MTSPKETNKVPIKGKKLIVDAQKDKEKRIKACTTIKYIKRQKGGTKLQNRQQTFNKMTVK